MTFLLVLVLSCRARFVRAVEGADAQKPSRRAALNAAIASLRSHHGQQDPSSGVSAASRTPPVFIPSFLPQLRASEQRNPAKHPYPHRVTLPPLHNTRSPSPPRLSLSRFPKQPRRSGLRLPPPPMALPYLEAVLCKSPPPRRSFRGIAVARSILVVSRIWVRDAGSAVKP